MSNASRTARSFEPPCFHQLRSNARISRSRSVSCNGASGCSTVPPWPDRVILPYAAEGFWDGGSGVKPAGEVGFCDSSDAERQRRQSQSHVLLLRERGRCVERRRHNVAKLAVYLVLAPEVRLDVLYPLEIANRYAAGVREDVWDDVHAARRERVIGLRRRRPVRALNDELGADLVCVLGAH